MVKSHSFSIYLLKQDFNEHNSLKDGHALVPASASYLPENSVMYVLDSDPRPPWWKEYFGLSLDLLQVTKGTLIFLHVEQRCFALCVGHVFHHLKDDAYEYDFGLRVTLNAVDPNELKSTDVVEPSSSRRRRTQLPTGSELTFFDFDQDSTIIKSLVGKVKNENKDLFSHVTGSSSIRVNSKILPERLPDLCLRLLNLYQSEAYLDAFPGIHNIEPVKDPRKVQQLVTELIGAFREHRDDLYLTVPDILNYKEGITVSFSGAGKSLSYEDLYTNYYYDYLASNRIDVNEITEEMLKEHKLNLVNENGVIQESFSIYRCVSIDIEIVGEPEFYHLCDGSWYRVNQGYVARLQAFLDPCFKEIVLPPFSHNTEGQYNRAVATADNRMICLDETNISPRTQTKVEPCDLYTIADAHGVFYHVKISTRSALLSHLFNQGVNSVELISSDEAARDKLIQLVEANIGSNNVDEYLTPIKETRYRVVYAIVTKKSKANKSKNLPLFSRISLMRSIKSLRLMKVSAVCCFVDDRTVVSAGVKKVRKKRVSQTDVVIDHL